MEVEGQGAKSILPLSPLEAVEVAGISLEDSVLLVARYRGGYVGDDGLASMRGSCRVDNPTHHQSPFSAFSFLAYLLDYRPVKCRRAERARSRSPEPLTLLGRPSLDPLGSLLDGAHYSRRWRGDGISSR